MLLLSQQSVNKRSQFVACPRSTKEAKRFLAEYKRVDIAVDAYYNEPVQSRQASIPQPSTSKLNALFDTYKGEPPVVIVGGTVVLNLGLRTRR